MKKINGQKISENGQKTSENGQKISENGQKTSENGQKTSENGQKTSENGQKTYSWLDEISQKDDLKKDQKQINKDNWKSSRQTISHTYKIQTRKTRKRMMASRCKASHFNGDNTLFCSTLHKLYKHGQVYRFFGLSDSDCNFYNNRVGGEIKQAKQEQHPTRF